MKSLFKTLGSGIIYFILSPIFIAIFAFMICYSIINVVISTLLFPIKFFSGKKLKTDEEQIRLKEAKENRKLNVALNPQPIVQPNQYVGHPNNFAGQPNQYPNQQNYYPGQYNQYPNQQNNYPNNQQGQYQNQQNQYPNQQNNGGNYHG